MPNGPESQPGVEQVVADKEEEGSEDEWEQVGPRNKTSITRQADFVRTPITDIFGGHIRYVARLLTISGHGFISCFYCSQLIIQPFRILVNHPCLCTTDWLCSSHIKVFDLCPWRHHKWVCHWSTPAFL